ncbi:hypothetical protein ABT084_18125 [Streptomyces sp. NPDC002138]|uniref:hypothetical protein n=1 Tax=Streptomyces sp. NPDC002138 TaxID=3154410 RepID=UPI00332C7A6E
MPDTIRGQLQQDDDGDTYPVPYDPRFLFAVGGTDNGEYLFWISEPESAPDRWCIAVHEARGPCWFRYDGALTAFLASVLSGKAPSPDARRTS